MVMLCVHFVICCITVLVSAYIYGPQWVGLSHTNKATTHDWCNVSRLGSKSSSSAGILCLVHLHLPTIHSGILHHNYASTLPMSGFHHGRKNYQQIQLTEGFFPTFPICTLQNLVNGCSNYECFCKAGLTWELLSLWISECHCLSQNLKIFTSWHSATS
jgi:hypothetical protein